MLDLSEPRNFHPESLSRKAELVTWVLALVVLVAWWVLQSNQARFATTAVILFAFLIFAAFAMSLGNWMDRHTVLRLDSEGVHFRNGIRDVRLAWDAIEELRVLPGQAGSRRVQVLGHRVYFEYRTLAEVRLNDTVKGRSGFEAGDAILEMILAESHLAEQEKTATHIYYGRP